MIWGGGCNDITWTHLNLFHRQVKLLCDPVQETKGSICRGISRKQLSTDRLPWWHFVRKPQTFKVCSTKGHLVVRW